MRDHRARALVPMDVSADVPTPHGAQASRTSTGTVARPVRVGGVPCPVATAAVVVTV